MDILHRNAHPGHQAGQAELAIHFFVIHPAKWMRDEMFPTMVRAEIPVFGLEAVEQLPRVCHRYPGSVFCINAAHHHDADSRDWPRLLADLSHPLNQTRSTVIYLSRSDQRTRHYEALHRLDIRMAVMDTHHLPRTAMGQIHGVASKFTAHGRRKNIRVGCGAGGLAAFNVLVDGQPLRGTIRDISSSGMAAFVFEKGGGELREGTELRDLQLRLRGSLILVDGSLVAVRHDQGRCVWIVLFRWGEDLRSKARIQEFISQRLQEELDEFLR